MNPGLEVTVEIFIRVQLRRITRQIDDLDLVLPALQPSFDLLAVMDAQVVQHQEDLAAGVLDQPRHEPDQDQGAHLLGIGHEAHLTLVSHRRNEIEAVPFGRRPDRRRQSDWV